MNKYQEALKTIMWETDTNQRHHLTGEYMLVRDIREDECYLLQELVEKETPKKPYKYTDNLGLEHEYCPICNDKSHKVYAKVPYCQYCGQKLGWR